MRKRTAMGWVAVAALLAGASPSPADSARVTNAVLAEAADGKPAVRFDLAWEKSWRDDAGHDACWVFVKYSADNGATWRHADLAASGVNPSGFSPGAGVKLEIVVPADKRGAFIRRAEAGTGAVANTGVTLPLHAASAKDFLAKKTLIKVLAVEMVHVAGGSFHLGTPKGSESGHFHDGADSNAPFEVRSEGAIKIANAPGGLWGGGDRFENQIGPPGVLPAAYPKGFAAFYLMKMELSQRQYCDFLNTLTAQQQNSRHDAKLNFEVFDNDVPSRNYIKKTAGSPAFFGCDANSNAGPATAATASSLNETNDGEWVACTWISWMDLAAYMDWAALRPMTELEFEKACRGPQAPVANDYPWGTAKAQPSQHGGYPFNVINMSTAAERPQAGFCNIGQYAVGAFRCGSFADSGPSRTNTGAAYCGALDLAGNVGERVVTAGHPAGRAFTGLHGNGALSDRGNADVECWPGLTEGEVTDALGAGTRGGYWLGENGLTRVSDRRYAAAIVTVRYSVYGGRAARTAP